MSSKLHPAYIAGLIDAGGYYQKRRRKTWTVYQLRVTMPSLEVAQLVANQFGGLVKNVSNGWKVEWYKQEEIQAVLDYAKPYLLKIFDSESETS